VPLGPVTPAQRAKVPKAVAGLSGNGHSAQFDLVYDAAVSLATQAPLPSASSVVLLTDGDISRTDPHGKNMLTTISTLRELGVKVYVIAFGPAGCGETPSGLSADSLTRLAQAGGGTCVNAASGGLAQQLAQDISTLSTGGG
jgi:Mg-chelatase subunit ChlD